jgi:hypothetical protein
VDEAPEELRREISATPAEYAHALRGAFPAGLSGGPLHYRIETDEVIIEIDLTPGPERRIALLTLPTLYARIRFLSGAAEARAKVLRHMDLAMQRGGG